MADGWATPTPLMQVHYLLIVLKHKTEPSEWQFPKRWSQNQKKHDHSGKFYCLEAPLTVCFTIIKNLSLFPDIVNVDWKCVLSIVFSMFDLSHCHLVPHLQLFSILLSLSKLSMSFVILLQLLSLSFNFSD